jgi:hypothetical protein
MASRPVPTTSTSTLQRVDESMDGGFTFPPTVLLGCVVSSDSRKTLPISTWQAHPPMIFLHLCLISTVATRAPNNSINQCLGVVTPTMPSKSSVDAKITEAVAGGRIAVEFQGWNPQIPRVQATQRGSRQQSSMWSSGYLITQQQKLQKQCTTPTQLCSKGVMIGPITQSTASAEDHTNCLAFRTCTT